jgi:hypothetical protein
VVSSFQGSCATEIKELDGLVAQYLGDGVELPQACAGIEIASSGSKSGSKPTRIKKVAPQ